MKIAIHGPMCSGKTTISKIIMDHDKRYKTYSFGKKVKDVASDLFNMKNKDRSLLINIATKMREIDSDVWAKYTLNEIKKDNINYCLIDDLRFQNEANFLKDWIFISLTTPKHVRIERIKNIYPDNFQDHIDNMNHISETGNITLPGKVIYLDTSINFDDLKNKVLEIIS